MKNYFINLLLICSALALAASCTTKSNQNSGSEPAETYGKVFFGDPFILLHENTYYAYGTSADNGILVYTSDDLLNWYIPEPSLALNKEDVWAERWFWAPEVYFIDGQFYMYYSADEHINVATSDTPLGPFVQAVKKPMLEEEKAIDNSLFIDEDGTAYLYFDRFQDGLSIWVAELESNLKEIKKETMSPCIEVSQEWEKVWPTVNEGSFIIKHKDTYFMTYSANSYESPFYGIGLATAPSPLGPWTKYEGNPIYQNVGELTGIGHSAMFKDKEGNLRIVFHSHYSQTSLHPRVMHLSRVYFEEKEGETLLRIDPKYITPQLHIQ
ncbi:MAG: glycoside hydrolase family 43 protein [Tannerellaceae bacterium]|jgi:beta-xylosidase|nr:glycoside hydrolase family 43 protein [Tannerellaceae bacterium]